MLIRPVSDTHLDFDWALRKRFKLSSVWEPIEMDTDKDTVLLIAGDLWIGARSALHAGDSWLGKMSTRFKHVVFVLGNHDLWGTNISNFYRKLREIIVRSGMTNVHLLEKSSVVIDGYRFIGSTLWTDMNRGDPLTKMSMDITMRNDHMQIRVGPAYHRFKWFDWIAAHQAAKQFIIEAATRSPEPCIVLSHHAPTPLSTDPRHIDKQLENGFYCSDLTDIVFDHPNIILWHHGHVHKKFDYLVGNTRFICNPRGYLGQNDNTGYDPRMIIDTSDLNKLEEEIDRWDHFKHLL
jgi:predicted MPP superfamily phosphohydrolase